MRLATGLAIMLLAAPAFAQTATQGTGAPPAGSGGGGPVNESVPTPRTPQGYAPPGTPSAQTPGGQVARDAVGTAVLGKTQTPASPVPGNTGGAETGARK